MRTLHHLEGGLVTATGRIQHKHLRKDIPNAVDVLLTSVKIYRWDGVSAITLDRDTPDATTDHMWLRMPIAGCEGSELLSKTFVIGRVGWYSRASGDVDLGVTALVAHDIDAVYLHCCDLVGASWRHGLHPLRAAIETLDEALKACADQGKEAYVYSRYISIASATKRLTRIRLQLSRSLAATESRLATAPKTGPCTKFREADPFFALKRRKAVRSETRAVNPTGTKEVAA